jgi:hypothetical protein
MGYQDPFNTQRPPWEVPDDSGYGRYTGPRANAFQPPADAFERDAVPRGEFPRDQFERDQFERDQFERDQLRGRHGGSDTSVDLFRPIDRATIDGREYGVTGDGSAAQTGPQRRARGRRGMGRRSRGLLTGGIAGFLAAAVAIGVANLAAAFVRPQASPIIAVGGDFIDRTPPALKNFAVEKFGENDKNMLLLGMYVTIALIAIVIGMIAWRYLWAGVAGIGAFGAFGAFVAYTRPASHPTDVIPSVVGGIAGIVAIVCLTQWTRPQASGAPEASGRSRSNAVRSEWVA